MKLRFIILLILSITLSNCTIHKKRYSRGFTVERNSTFNSFSKKKETSLKHEEKHTQEEQISAQDSTLILTHSQSSSETREKQENSNTYEKKLKKSLNLAKNKLVPTKALRKIENLIVPVLKQVENEKKINNTNALIGLTMFIIGILFTTLILLPIASEINMIVLLSLSFLSLYIFTLKSFKDIRERKVKNKWISIVNFVILCIILALAMLLNLIGLLFSLSYLEPVLIILLLLVALIIILLFLILLLYFIKSMRAKH